ncbi:MAG: 2-oxoglutarate dehydrogenase complex dihydrolipoyllysine-residue succinyltransferase [Deltaproteobacteria bacterium]|nr:2-oxoglutarate dehydrogenase complex dihydrolipoyllysine-residue succinyltransferase [Deltaproteobacteria bacterium]
MAVELKVPAVGESITEVEIGEWLKNEGDSVAMDETIVMIETDKVTAEVIAPVAGTITQIIKKQGEVAQVGDLIGYMEEGAVDAKPAVAAPAAPEAATTPTPPANAVQGHVMPAAQRAMATTGVNPADVQATGPGGRVLKEDVMRAASGQPAAQPQAPTPAAPPAVKAAPPAAKKPAPVMPAGERQEDVVPMTPLRRRVASRLVEAQQNAALLTTFNEIDMSYVMNIRKKYKEAFIGKYDAKLGFMSFFIKAAIDGLKEIPQINAEIRGKTIVYKNYYDIGVAVGGGKGLVVPVIRNAERLSFAQVEQTIVEYAVRAKANKLTLDEMTGGTFTISNGGVYGSLLSTPIVNPPQSGILGLHGIKERPIALNGEVVIRPMMYIALTYDHRIVDGREAVTFLKRVKDCIEAPERMLLEI